MGMFDFDGFISLSIDEYEDIRTDLWNLLAANKSLRGQVKNQADIIRDLRNEITDLKKQNGDLCELVGKTKKETKDYEAMQNELRSLQDENAARIEAYEKLDKRYKDLVNDCSKAMVKNVHYGLENYRLRRKLDNGCNTCPDMENTKKKNDELRELIDFKRNQIEEQATTIRDLDKKLTELRAGAKDLQEQNQILKDSIKQLQDVHSKQEEDIRCNCMNTFAATLKDADAKIQSTNDKAANAKKEAKQAKETAERYREENFVLHRQIDQFKKLNDELIKELARKGED